MTPATATLPGRRKPGAIARSLFQLTKPRIIELLLVTTIPTKLLAQRGLPSLRVFAVTLIGGTLAAASANTLNCYLDRDIDAVTRRCASNRRRTARTTPAGHRSPWRPGI